jgi:hypothetical protein
MADVCPLLTSPLTTRACADYLGLTRQWVHQAVTEGVHVGNTLVKLEAERLELNKRVTYRIHGDKFVEFLQAIGWKRLPRIPTGPELS